MPVLMVILGLVVPRVLASRSPPVDGEIAVLDPGGSVVAPLRAALAPDAIRTRRQLGLQQRVEQVAPGWGGAAGGTALTVVPTLRVLEPAAGADLAAEKRWLGTASPALAVIVVHADAVAPVAATGEYGSYDLYIAPSLDEATEEVLRDALRQTLVDLRLAARGLASSTVAAMLRVDRPHAVTVGAAGQQQARRGLDRALPFVLGLLVFIGVIMGGQALMTSTIEEKSSRIVEVLLAAVSPLELMWGKLVGQLGVGLLVMSVYVALGLLALAQFAVLGLLNPVLIVYLFVFFLLTYLVFGALMMAIGAAVNQVADAQPLMGPIMLLLIAPYVMAPVIGRAPNSTFSIVASFVPPVNTFAMLARLSSGTPPPFWQVALTILVGLAAAALAVWFAAKIFKIGLLMHGTPPSYATLLRWARSA